MKNVTNWVRRAAVAGVALASCAVYAEDGGWRLSIGGSYRMFDDVSYGAVDLPGSTTSETAGGPFGIQYLQAHQPAFPTPSQITLDVVSYNGSDAELDDGSLWAPIIGAEYTLSSDNEGECSWVLAANFQYFGLETSGVGANGITGESRNYFILDSGGEPTIIAPSVSSGPMSATTIVTADQSFDMDLYVFDLGIKGTHKVGGVTLGVAAGPTINISDVETSQSFNVTTAAIPNAVPAPNAPATNGSDDDTDISLGLYLGLSAAVDLSDTVAVGLGYRYDWVSEDAGTSQAELDLSSSSLQLTFQVKF